MIQISQPDTGMDEWNAVRGPIERGWLTQGPCVAEFERGFAAKVGAPHAIATSSCTTALHLILVAMGIGPGDEVIVPSFTWVATANVVVYCGATPVFADVSREHFNMDPAQLPRLITPRTRAIIAVHLFGLCADIDAMAAAAPGIPIVEDAACAAGSGYRGRQAGSLGVAGAFSFHPRKSITTGEGGMVTTADAALAERITMLRNHGAEVSEEQRHSGPRPYLLPEFNLLGFNYRMTDLQGAVGVVQLGKLDQYIAGRAQGARFYHDQLSSLPWLRLPAIPAGDVHGWQSFVCYVNPACAPLPRNEIMARLLAGGVSTRPGTHAVHLLGYYRDRFGLRPDDFPAARDCDAQSMAIPLHNRMSQDDYTHVVRALKQLA